MIIVLSLPSGLRLDTFKSNKTNKSFINSVYLIDRCENSNKTLQGH